MFYSFFGPDSVTYTIALLTQKQQNLAVKVYLAEARPLPLSRSSLSLLNYTRRVQSVSPSHIRRASPSLLVVYHPMSAEPTADKQVEESSRRGWLGAKRQMARSLEEDNGGKQGKRKRGEFFRGEFVFFFGGIML